VGLTADLGRGRTGIDTSVFIYFMEEDPRFLPLIEPLFRDADEDRRELVASALTLLEVMVVPYRAGNEALAERYEQLLTRSRGLLLDALRLAAALTAGCTTFLTNDRRIPAVSGIRVLQLADYVT
jgi:predicted nucleic acid-binding protein